LELADPVASELAELREALLGEGGLAERLDAGRDEDLDGKVAVAVERAVAASEQRLSAHFDDAVLALAEALLRRRTGRSGGVRAAVVRDPAPAAPGDGALAAPGQAAPADGDDEPEQIDDRPERASVDAPVDAPVDGAPPWQTPPDPGVRREPAEPPSEPADADRRRRPWWRPGD
jgi:hypothetical protein